MATAAKHYAWKLWTKAWREAWSGARNWSALVTMSAGLAGYFGFISDGRRAPLAWEIPLAFVTLFLAYRIPLVSYQLYSSLEIESQAAFDRLAEKSSENIKALAEKNETLQQQLAERTNHQALADELTVMHERGKQLMRPPTHLRDNVAEDAQIQVWIDETLEIMRKYNCSPQEMHHMDVQHADLLMGFEAFKGKTRRIAVFTQRIADTATAHANIARDLALAARRGS